ncbi:MAG: hypothetical protein IPL81_14440 [Flavobacteriales bacterium]|jgi:hypothetical protein|nr:hypothetical protein [Flavobacteriales bacterium]MBK7286701.1 hypothetical protein [Flavobacteriales bacterium]MBK9061003.1 hypothetical protein [Flavobacteriales bacterium]
MPRPILLLFLFTLLACNGLMAQETIGLRVDALTSAERDSLVSLSHHAGDPQVIYACVPAGILVFASAEPTASREVLRTRVFAALAPVLAIGRIDPAELTLHDAESACETARGQ